MGAWFSKPSVCRSSPALSEPLSPPSASALDKETRDGARGLSGILACIAPSEGVGPLRKLLRSSLPEVGGGLKRIKDVGNGGVRDTAPLNDDGQFQLASAEPESVLFSSQPSGAASGMVSGASESAHGLQSMSSFELDGAKHEMIRRHATHMMLGPSGIVNVLQLKRSFKLDGAKHKIFLSHAGAQKDFVEQLCVDLERVGYIFPFFDRRHYSLSKGQDFAPLIIEAARLCHVAVIVLSKEFLCSKWPMIELATFYDAQQGGGGGGSKPILFPLFFKLSVEEVKDEGRWMLEWKEHAQNDNRIDLAIWSAAVKALCKSNGCDFKEVGRKEVAYRKWIVESIFKLCAPDFSLGTFESMVGSGRMCEAMSTQFVEDPIVGARVLAIHGMTGLGKTLLSKAMHDYLFQEFLGKVFYVDMRKGLRAQRQEGMLKFLCRFEKNVVDFLGDDVDKGLVQIRRFVKRERVFLIIDNITNDVDLLKEVQDYLKMGFHPESRLLITSSSKAILEDLLPHMELYISMPSLTFEEASILFLERAGLMKSISELTSEEHKILGICLQKCWFDSQEGGWYHPLVLTALAKYLSRVGRAKKNHFLVWKEYLDMDKDLVNDVLKSSKGFIGILGLHFSTFDFSEKLLFLDIALYLVPLTNRAFLQHDDIISRLCRLHDIESRTYIDEKLWELKKSGMIDFDYEETIFPRSIHFIEVPHLYRDFAKWYVQDHKEPGLKNAWGVFQPRGTSQRGESSTPIKSWSNLIRLRIFPMTKASAQLVASSKMKELSNLVVLQLSRCDMLEVLNLEGLHCLRYLELYDLHQLKTISFVGNSVKEEYIGIYDSLQHVQFEHLGSLVDMPDLRLCTSLHSIIMFDCDKVRNFERVSCSRMKDLTISTMKLECIVKSVHFSCLKSLEILSIEYQSNAVIFNGDWQKALDESDMGLEITFEDIGPCFMLLQEMSVDLYKWNRMICTDISGSPYEACVEGDL